MYDLRIRFFLYIRVTPAKLENWFGAMLAEVLQSSDRSVLGSVLGSVGLHAAVKPLTGPFPVEFRENSAFGSPPELLAWRREKSAGDVSRPLNP